MKLFVGDGSVVRWSLDVGAGASRAVHIRLLTVWDGAGSEKRKIVGYSLGLKMDRLSLSFHIPRSMRILTSNLASQVVMKVNVKVGDKNMFNSLTSYFAISKYLEIFVLHLYSWPRAHNC